MKKKTITHTLYYCDDKPLCHAAAVGVLALPPALQTPDIFLPDAYAHMRKEMD